MAVGRKRGRIVRSIVLVLAVLAIGYAVLLASVWNNRVELIFNSTALGEPRSVTVFGPATLSHALAIYSLDGERSRNGLVLAANAVVISTLRGQPSPVIVAIYSGASRNRDFRPSTVSPASWRPDIAGRSPLFDAFLIEEARAVVESRFGTPEKRWLFGHSLAGLYALDMPTRRASHGFSAVHAFSPTFSHDLSVIGRLNLACKSTVWIYANIGIESARDSKVFEDAEQAFATAPDCRRGVTLSRHYGMLHQVIMLSGQIEALSR